MFATALLRSIEMDGGEKEIYRLAAIKPLLFITVPVVWHQSPSQGHIDIVKPALLALISSMALDILDQHLIRERRFTPCRSFRRFRHFSLSSLETRDNGNSQLKFPFYYVTDRGTVRSRQRYLKANVMYFI